MKKLFIFTFALVAFTLNAQNISESKVVKPTYEVEDGLVKVTKYYATGEVKEQGYYDSDKKLTGKWVQFNKEGKKVMMANYYKGKKVGKWFVWQKNTLLEVDYEGHKIASVSKWKGEIIADN